MTVLPMTTTKDDPHVRMFDHPDSLRGDGPELIYCGHFDGHDVYRRLDVDLFVLVYGNAKEAVFEVFGSKVWRWLAEVKDPNTDSRYWGSMRAVVKARASLSSQIDSLVERLRDVVMYLPDEGHNGWCRRAVDVCSEASDLIETLKKGVGI